MKLNALKWLPPKTASMKYLNLLKCLSIWSVFARLEELRAVHRRHILDRDERAAELEQLQAECVKIKKEAPTLADRFQFYQDLRGYVTDLVECLDEKVGGLLVSSMGGLPVIRHLPYHALKVLKKIVTFM